MEKNCPFSEYLFNMKKRIKLTESELIRLIRKVMSEQIDPNAWKTSPKANETKTWSQFFNQRYKLNLPIDGNWKNPEYGKAMERYIKEKGLPIWVCKKGDGYCHDEDAGEVTVKGYDVDKLYNFREEDMEGVTETTEQPKNVKVFQDWLDKYYPNWIKGGKLNKGRGYGTFGPYTKAAWTKYKSQYKEA